MVVEGVLRNDQVLLLNLKRELDGALKNLAAKEGEIAALKKCQKVTKHKELEVSVGVGQLVYRKRGRRTSWSV
jgi:hypothetical protein